jgi:hypothetical protein
MDELGGNVFYMMAYNEIKQEKDSLMKGLYNLMKIDGDI